MDINKNLVNKVLATSLGISLLIIILGALAITIGPSDLLKDYIKGDELKEIDFETFKGGNLEDQYLVCPEDFCLETTPDLIAPLFNQTTKQLRATLLEYVDNDQTVTTKSMDLGKQQFTFLVQDYSKTFPDVITIRFIDLQGLYSSVAIYARTEIGEANIGLNEKLANRWLTLLKKNE